MQFKMVVVNKYEASWSGGILFFTIESYMLMKKFCNEFYAIGSQMVRRADVFQVFAW